MTTRQVDTSFAIPRIEVVALNSILGHAYPVLDLGHLRVIDYMGDQTAITQAARVSYGEGTESVSSDRGLLRYLLRHHHCYHPDMQVLTVKGWKYWYECDPVEEFMIPDPETHTYRKEKLPVKRFSYQGKMFTFDNSRMSYCVTPEHKMWFRGKYANEFSLVTAEEKSNWGYFDPMTEYCESSLSHDADPLYELVGFYLGDGSYGSTNRIAFRLKKDRKKEYICRVLNELRLDYKESPDANDDTVTTFWVEPSTQFWDIVERHDRAADKWLNQNKLSGMTVSEKKGLFNGLINSDTHINLRRNDRLEFSSTSENLRVLFEVLAASFGYDAHRNQKVDTVHAYPSGRTTLESRQGYHGEIDYSGDVFCTTSSTGLLMVRGDQDKFGFVCGNSTPFEMCELKFHVKAPIFVARQWIRHRMSSTNEYSGRYSIMPNEFYLPPLEQVSFQSGTNNQGRGEVIPLETAQAVLDLLTDTSQVCRKRYDRLCDDHVSRELARIGLTLNSYTEWYWKIDLHNLLHFLNLRMDSHAQWEIRMYANQIFEFLKLWVPDVVEAFTDYTLEARTFSKQELLLLKRKLSGEDIQFEGSGLSKREWGQFLAFFN